MGGQAPLVGPYFKNEGKLHYMLTLNGLKGKFEILWVNMFTAEIDSQLIQLLHHASYSAAA